MFAVANYWKLLLFLAPTSRCCCSSSLPRQDLHNNFMSPIINHLNIWPHGSFLGSCNPHRRVSSATSDGTTLKRQWSTLSRASLKASRTRRRSKAWSRHTRSTILSSVGPVLTSRIYLFLERSVNLRMAAAAALKCDVGALLSEANQISRHRVHLHSSQ